MLRVLTWNLAHGRDHPPDERLRTWRSRLLRISERNATHIQVNRDLFDEFASMIAASEWDIALFQEAPPRWAQRLAEHCRADAHISLTARNALAPLRSAFARLNPDLIASNEGGSNLTLIRGDAGAELRELELRPSPARRLRRQPERRTMAFTRLASGLCVANLHASKADRVSQPEADVRLAAQRAVEWSDGAPLILGGDFNLRQRTSPALFDELEAGFELRFPTVPTGIDHLLSRNLEILSPPTPWPAARRELQVEGLRLRLSDHSPVEATFARSV